MSEQDWQFQASFKLAGDVLLNVRALNSDEFESNLNAAITSAALKDAQAFFAPQKPAYVPPASAPAAATRQPYGAPQRTVGAETGPVGIKGVMEDKTDKNGVAMRNVKYTVMFSDGGKFSTFDGTLGRAAVQLYTDRREVFYGTEPSRDLKYVNLAAIRSAS